MVNDILTNLILLNYASYMDPYIVFIIVCYNKSNYQSEPCLKSLINVEISKELN
jgi:hypothetical protein